MYWERKGKSNTDATVAAAAARSQALGIGYVVVASNTGETAMKLVGEFREVVCVTHHVGYSGPGDDEMPASARRQLEENGVKVLTTTHLLAGVDRAVRNKFGGIYPTEIIAQTLRMLGQGVKVGVEIAGMALDAGLIPYGEDIIAIGGTGSGADTAIVVRPAHSNQFFDTQVREIICKPREI